MYIGTLFGKYPVHFDVEQSLGIIVGANGTGKTKTLELLRDYFVNQRENVIYLPTFRKFNLNKDEVEGIFMIQKLLGQDFFTKYGIKFDPYCRLPELGEYINSGFNEIINMFGTIIKAAKPSIVLIDNIEKSIYFSIRTEIIDDLMQLDNVKKLYVVTHCPEILGDHRQEAIDIKSCVDLRKEFVL